jgi:hypothetical protein
MESEGKKSKVGWIVILLILLIPAAGLLLRSEPKWSVADSGTLELQPGQAYIDEIRPFARRPIRVTLKERNGFPMVAFWLVEADHKLIQSSDPPPDSLLLGLVQRIEKQTFLRTSTGSQNGATVLEPGTVYLYFEPDQDEPTSWTVDYTIEVFR